MTRRVSVLFAIGAAVTAALYGCTSDEEVPKTTTTTTTDASTTADTGGGNKDSGGSVDTGTTTPDTGTKADTGTPGPVTAQASLQPTSDASAASGLAVFTEYPDGGTSVTITVASADPGLRGVHIHANGDCGDAGAGAGGHWNPLDAGHGFPDAAVHHLGDMGNIDVQAGGAGSLTLYNLGWTVKAGTNSVVGHAVIFHGGTDDGVSQPAGDAGPRRACGVIAAN